MGTLTLNPERQSAPMSKITKDSLTRSGTGSFIAVPIWQQWALKGLEVNGHGRIRRYDSGWMTGCGLWSYSWRWGSISGQKVLEEWKYNHKMCNFASKLPGVPQLPRVGTNVWAEYSASRRHAAVPLLQARQRYV